MRKHPKKDASGRFAVCLRAEKIGGWEREYRFHPTRLWRLDFAWPNNPVTFYEHTNLHSRFRLAVEIEGIVGGGKMIPCSNCGTKHFVANQGRHQTPQGIEEDCIKYAEALRLGWIVYRVTVKRMENREVFDLIRSMIGTAGAMPPEQEPLSLLPTPEF